MSDSTTPSACATLEPYGHDSTLGVARDERRRREPRGGQDQRRAEGGFSDQHADARADAAKEAMSRTYEELQSLLSHTPGTNTAATVTSYQLHHGDRDDIVPIAFDQVLVPTLRSRGIDTDLLIYPGGSHGGVALDATCSAACERGTRLTASSDGQGT
jgi:hypothetical protein